jgi:hypothetical protein
MQLPGVFIYPNNFAALYLKIIYEICRIFFPFVSSHFWLYQIVTHSSVLSLEITDSQSSIFIVILFIPFLNFVNIASALSAGIFLSTASNLRCTESPKYFMDAAIFPFSKAFTADKAAIVLSVLPISQLSG